MFVSTSEAISPQACPLKVSIENFSLVIFAHGPWLRTPAYLSDKAAKHVGTFFNTVFIGLGTWNSLNSHYWSVVALTPIHIF